LVYTGAQAANIKTIKRDKMNVEATLVNSANANVTAKITKETITAREGDMAKKIAKTMKVDGFRKGKVPAHVVKGRYGDQIKQDAQNELLQEVYQQGVKTLVDAEILGNPKFNKFEEVESGLEVEFSISLRPSIPETDYATLVPDFAVDAVSDKDIKKAIENAALSTVTPEKIKRKRMLKKGDVAIFDFEGSVDGEIVDDACAKNFSLEIGSDRLIPGFEDGMVGMKPEEEKTLELQFPQSYHAEHLKGKDVSFKINLTEIQERKMPELDDELAKTLLPNDEEATFEKLETLVKESLESEKTTKLYNDDLKPKLLENIVKAYSFDLPEIIVDEEVNALLNQKLQGLKEEEVAEYQKDETKVTALREEFKAEASERVKTTLLIDEIAKKESITITDQEVNSAIYYEAMQMQQDPKAMFEHYEKQGLLPMVKMSMLEDRVLSHLLNKKLKAA
jgi:trigger factor